MVTEGMVTVLSYPGVLNRAKPRARIQPAKLVGETAPEVTMSKQAVESDCSRLIYPIIPKSSTVCSSEEALRAVN